MSNKLLGATGLIAGSVTAENLNPLIDQAFSTAEDEVEKRKLFWKLRMWALSELHASAQTHSSKIVDKLNQMKAGAGIDWKALISAILQVLSLIPGIGIYVQIASLIFEWLIAPLM